MLRSENRWSVAIPVQQRFGSMARHAVAFAALMLVAASGAFAQSSTTSSSVAASSTPAQPVSSWAIFDPTAYSGVPLTVMHARSMVSRCTWPHENRRSVKADETVLRRTMIAGFVSALQTQLTDLQSNWGSQVSSVVSGLPSGILNLKTEASQLIADGSSQYAVLTDASQQTTCTPPTYVPPTKVRFGRGAAFCCDVHM